MTNLVSDRISRQESSQDRGYQEKYLETFAEFQRFPKQFCKENSRCFMIFSIFRLVPPIKSKFPKRNGKQRKYGRKGHGKI